MNLETRIDQRLWSAVQSSVGNRDYSGAILDAMHFVSDLLRERSGLESDGVALVGQALGGDSPKLKVNRLQSESDKNVQKGVAQLLMGLYTAIRNPRSHERHADKLDDAESIIVFIDYLVRIIDQSKSPFTKEAFMARVFDTDFVPEDRYAQLLVKEIPPRQRLDVFVGAYRAKDTGEGEKLAYFFTALYDALTGEERKQACEMISEELKTTDEESDLRLAIQLMPPSSWPTYDEAARMRAENRLLRSVGEGRYDSAQDRLRSGALGTWITHLGEHFGRVDELFDKLAAKLRAKDETQRGYVFKYFFDWMQEMADDPPGDIAGAIKAGLRRGDFRFKDALFATMLYGKDGWQSSFKKEYDDFKGAQKGSVIIEDDDLPF